MEQWKYEILGWDLAIARFQPRPCRQLGASPHLTHAIILLMFGHLCLPFNHHCLPFGHQGLPFGLTQNKSVTHKQTNIQTDRTQYYCIRWYHIHIQKRFNFLIVISPPNQISKHNTGETVRSSQNKRNWPIICKTINQEELMVIIPPAAPLLSSVHQHQHP